MYPGSPLHSLSLRPIAKQLPSNGISQTTTNSFLISPGALLILSSMERFSDTFPKQADACVLLLISTSTQLFQTAAGSRHSSSPKFAIPQVFAIGRKDWITTRLSLSQFPVVHSANFLLEFKAEAVNMGVEDPETMQSLSNLHIDPAFVVDPEHRSQRKYNDYSVSGGHVPVVDLGPLREQPTEAETKSIVAKIGQACEEWGFFQVVNHGVSLALLEELEATAKQFFDLPLEEKRKVRRTLDNGLGYYDSELTKNRRDWKEVFDFVPSGSFKLHADDESLPKTHNQWPSTPLGLREVCEKWSRAVERLALELLGLIAQSLGLPATHFHEHWKQDMRAIRLNYYPKCPHPDVVLGVSRHKDPGALTVLVQDEVGGLEVRRKDGEWVGIQPRRDAFVINVGDAFQVWSNDRYRSIEHRVVVNENKERFSFPLFFNPSSETDVAPVPEILGQDLPLYRSYNFGHFLTHRTTTNYQVLGEDNIQISDFAINRD